MTMITCKNCSKPIEVKKGRRPREFCDNNQKCRNEYFRKNKKEATHKSIPIEQWKEIEAQMELAKIKLKGGSVSGVDISSQINDLTKPTNIVQPQKSLGTDKTNVVIKTDGTKKLTPYEEMLKKKRGF